MPSRRTVIALLSLCFAVLVGCTDDGASARPEAAIPTSPPLPRERTPVRAAEPGPSDEHASGEFTATESGLKYRILRKADGPQPKPTDSVTVNYRGWLDDGTIFDSSYTGDDTGNPLQHQREPTSFPLGGVIKGWTEGLQLIGEGGKIELEIPFELAYGEQGSPPRIPPRARLHFLVELLKVN
jgi:FKBP-type peptidyl-prolyl cis-trans isomerase FkpA